MNAPAQLNPQIAAALYRELYKLRVAAVLSAEDRVVACRSLMYLVFEEATRWEKLPFSTHFARMAYAAHKYSLPKALQYYTHRFRRSTKFGSADNPLAIFELGCKVVADLIFAIWRVAPDTETAATLPLEWPEPIQEVKVVDFRYSTRVLVVADDEDAQQLIAHDQDYPEQEVRIQYHLADRNEQFDDTIKVIRHMTGFPVQLNLLDVEVDESGNYRPRGMVLEPDFLVDVSGVAECFQGSNTHEWGYLLKKFLPFRQTVPIMLGNIANFFLDQLMNDPDVTFKDLTTKIFSLNPLAFCLLSDREVREMLQKAQGHFVRLKQMVVHGFAAEGMNRDYCYLEPSFYGELYGLQGRLDLLYRSPQYEGRTAIVELKSGRPFMPNVHGISPNHFIQTLLYDLLVRAAYGAKTNVGCYILYSSQEDRPLRFAPAVRAQQYEALVVRNRLLAIEYLLETIGADGKSILQSTKRVFKKLHPGQHPKLRGFALADMKTFAEVFWRLSPLEQTYFGAYTGFIAREHRLSKTGVQGSENRNGLASLWLDDPQEKEDNYQRLAKLELVINKSTEPEPVLVLLRKEHTNPLANFRAGDIAVLFPFTEDGRGVLTHQIFKCTVLYIDAEQVTVRLRSQQFNVRLFVEEAFWTLEHDLLDSSINAYYRGLFEWAGQPAATRQLLLGQRPPQQGPAVLRQWPEHLTEEQSQLLDRILAAPEYFLLWGPPGTGKTSVMLHHLTAHLLRETDETLLLLAYTNRAVDEICEAIEAIGDEVREQYLRVGSNYGANDRFKERLLQNAIQGMTTRQELKNFIGKHRIFVGTVASLANNTDLFQLKQFDRVIIDEASQLLEPLLVGLLGRFKRWLLIGDHRQLPAVVAQDSRLTITNDEALNDIGIRNLRQSLFERLYLHCQQQGWHWAFGQLTHQGRMHEEIMAFPAEHFYNGSYHCLPRATTRGTSQRASLTWQLPPDANVLEQSICRQRLLYLPTPVDESSANLKTNIHEARILVDLIKAYERIICHSGEAVEDYSIGIITPYRAQIAQIRALLAHENMDPERYTIDTVERYQGGARDIILISLCTNAERQMATLSALSDEGVDRKLNVAMTRARQHLVLLGNTDVMQKSIIYSELIDYCKSAK